MQQQWIGSSGWLVLALVNAGLAEQKGRSRWTWFLVSLLLGPIATFFIVTWERAPARPVGAPQEGPTNGLLAVGVGLAALAVVSAVVAAVGGATGTQVLGGGIGGDTGLWLLAAALAVVAVVSLVLHVLAHRRWAALRSAQAEADRSR
ncbi:hypothetical protein FGG90_14835 [Clavibacter tessellarius]|uniref:Uncharacterized protein n=1 Tax=Clavibacter tessellarius TaxID=31965 RepID=A0A225CHJ3_9MICO|nr:hypothetical protein [Clavibacter michiganensis]OQJ61876.1 hypothetical protein B5P24_01940 [Clavibacter michiganensis subsp. tessellarius]UKF35136.1 hypothetical protein FGG90_14835 [Clavibacter michiganensis subsp. tessellarius]